MLPSEPLRNSGHWNEFRQSFESVVRESTTSNHAHRIRPCCDFQTIERWLLNRLLLNTLPANTPTFVDPMSIKSDVPFRKPFQCVDQAIHTSLNNILRMPACFQLLQCNTFEEVRPTHPSYYLLLIEIKNLKKKGILLFMLQPFPSVKLFFFVLVQIEKLPNILYRAPIYFIKISWFH